MHFKATQQTSADSRGLLALQPRSEQLGFRPYVEYGLVDRLTVGLGHETRLIKTGLEGDEAARTDGSMSTELLLRGEDWYMLSAQSINGLGDHPQSKSQLAIARSLSRSLNRQLTGWQMLDGDSADPSSGLEALLWLGY